MELSTIKLNTYMCLAMLLILAVLTNKSGAISTDQLQGAGWAEQVESDGPWLIKFREELRREITDLADAEDRIESKIRELAEERSNIRTMKRGHTQCFLNLVACYRRRK